LNRCAWMPLIRWNAREIASIGPSTTAWKWFGIKQ
jgi:hypothetical protein